MSRWGYERDVLLPSLVPALRHPEYRLRLSSALGRYWIPLLHQLTAAGGRVVVAGTLHRRDYEDPDAMGPAPLRMPGVRYSFVRPYRHSSTVLIAEAPPPTTASCRRWRKVLWLSTATDTRLVDVGPHVRLPFTMHPGLIVRGWDEAIVRQRLTPRCTRILFSGSTQRSLYDPPQGSEWSARFGIHLSRWQAIDTLREALTAEELAVADLVNQDGERAFDGSCEQRLFMAIFNAFRGERWVHALGRSRFFLALPGVRMPLCHNIVEAMAAGTIPITNYPGWMSPPLTDGKNCLVFTDGDDLVRVVRRALTLPEPEVRKLAAGAAAYYDMHLRPTAVPSSIEQLPSGGTIYLQTEDPASLARVGPGSVAFPAV